MRDSITLLLVRHAQRGTQGESGDEALSAEGRSQALRLASSLKAAWKVGQPEILSSPKLRAQETARSIAAEFQVSVKVVALLDERRSAESPNDLSDRVSEFIEECRSKSHGVIAVSHSDWLEEAGATLLGNRVFLRWMPATAHLFEIIDRKVVHSGLITA
jgi:broad specificity phosphatase PhoE